jgi:hypothetical protein
LKLLVVPTSTAIEESVDLAYEIFNRVFRKVPERISECGKSLNLVLPKEHARTNLQNQPREGM